MLTQTKNKTQTDLETTENVLKTLIFQTEYETGEKASALREALKIVQERK